MPLQALVGLHLLAAAANTPAVATDSACSSHGTSTAILPGSSLSACQCDTNWIGTHCQLPVDAPWQCYSSYDEHAHACYSYHLADDSHQLYHRLVVPSTGWTSLLFDSVDGMTDGRGVVVTASAYGFAAVPILAHDFQQPAFSHSSTLLNSSQTLGIRNVTHTDVQFVTHIDDVKDGLRIPPAGHAMSVSWAYAGTDQFSVAHSASTCGRLQADYRSTYVVPPDKPNYLYIYLPIICNAALLLIWWMTSALQSARLRSLRTHLMQPCASNTYVHALLDRTSPSRNTPSKRPSVLTSIGDYAALQLMRIRYIDVIALSLLAMGLAIVSGIGVWQLNRAIRTTTLLLGHITNLSLAVTIFAVIQKSNIAVKLSADSGFTTYHRVAAWLTLLFLWLHVVTVVNKYGLSTMWQYTHYSSGASLIPAFVACIALHVLILLAAIPHFRRRYYEAFYHTHIALTWIVCISAILHTVHTLCCIAAVLVLYILDWTMYVVDMLRTRATVQSVEVVTDETSEFVKLQLRLSNVICSAGQHVYLHIPAISWFQFHPYSVADVRQHQSSNSTDITIIVRNDIRRPSFAAQLANRTHWLEYFHSHAHSEATAKDAMVPRADSSSDRLLLRSSSEMSDLSQLATPSNEFARPGTPSSALYCSVLRVLCSRPTGGWQLPPPSEPLVLVAGGVGLTAVIGVAMQQVQTRLQQPDNVCAPLWLICASKNAATMTTLFSTQFTFLQQHPQHVAVLLFNTTSTAAATAIQGLSDNTATLYSADKHTAHATTTEVTSSRPNFPAVFGDIALHCQQVTADPEDTTQRRVHLLSCGPPALVDTCEKAAFTHHWMCQHQVFQR